MSATQESLPKANPGFSGRKHTAEAKARIKAKIKERVPPKSERINVSEAMTDKPKSAEAKANMAKAKEGTTMPEKSKEAIGESIKDTYKLDRMGRETRFLTLLASGQSVKQAAQTVGYSPSVAYQYAQNEQFRLAVMEATAQLRVMLYEDMPEMLALSKKTLMDTMRSPTARQEVKVKAAAHTISLAIFLASADKGFTIPADPAFVPPEGWDSPIEGEAVEE